MKKKAFTLLELLAVIIILAVIALITTPVVLNVVDEAKKSAFQDSAYGLIKSGEYYYTSQILNGGMTSDKVFSFPNNTELEFSGTEPESGYIKVTKDGLVEIAISNGKYCATKGLNEDKVTIKDYVEGECVIGDNELTQLQAPTISLNGDILNITPNDDHTEGYAIYVDGGYVTTVSAPPVAVATTSGTATVTDLTGTTWRLNNIIRYFNGGQDFSSELKNWTTTRGYYLDFCYSLSSGEFTATKIACGYVNGEYSLAIYRTNSSGNTTWLIPYSGRDTWSLTTNSDSYTDWTITITGGTDATDAILIAWFKANATQVIEDASTETVNFDLSSLNLGAGSYRITVKAVADGYLTSEFSNEVTYPVE